MATKKKNEEVKVEVSKVAEEAKIRNLNRIEIPKDYEVPVRSNVAGTLVYVSRKNRGLEVVWSTNEDIEYLTFDELISMRNTQRGYFENNWIMIEDSDYTASDVYKALSVSQFYQFSVNGIEEIFNLSDVQLKKVVPTLSDGFKSNIVNKAKELYVNGSDVFDSTKKRKLYEDLFDFKFEDNLVEA